MQANDSDGAERPVPSLYPGTEAAGPILTQVVRDGRSWALGTAADVEWITAATTVGTTITAAIPPVFDAYATVVLPDDAAARERHDEAVLSVLRSQSTDSAWCLGYLDTGADDVVFPDAPRVILYTGWPYVLVQAGPEQAYSWRSQRLGFFWSGRLPNLMFPADRSWLVTTLWDDDWTCIGGSLALVESLLSHPELRPRSRRVRPGERAAPPGHHTI